MTVRVGWLSPLTRASGIGTFSQAIGKHFPTTFDGETVEVSMLHPPHPEAPGNLRHRLCIQDTEEFRTILELFDVLVYNIGNNREHHETIFSLLRTNPGIVICHDFVYQHYVAELSAINGGDFASYAAFLMKFGGRDASRPLVRSRITSRRAKPRYAPWDSVAVSAEPMSEAILNLGSALIVHSHFSYSHAQAHFEGPITKLGLPHDLKPARPDTWNVWAASVAAKSRFHAVSFGHIQPTKCIELMLEALIASPTLKSQLHYTIAGFVGDGPYLEMLQGIVASEGLQDIVHFEKDISQERLSCLINEADLFVNLRRPNTEASSASLIEQLGSGRPVMTFDSGCYAEVPIGGSVKLPKDAGVDELVSALEALLASPAALPVIGQAGRDHSREWSCASYGEELLRFIFQNRALLQRRARIVGASDRQCEMSNPPDEAWRENLAKARLAFCYLNRDVLIVDPALIMQLDEPELCSYVAHVIFGVFDDERLYSSIKRYFSGRDRRSIVWGCIRFDLVMKAVANKGDARDRLRNSQPCFDPEFWKIVAVLSFVSYITIAFLIVLGRTASDQDLGFSDRAGRDDRSLKMNVLLQILKDSRHYNTDRAKSLQDWLEASAHHYSGEDLPEITQDTALHVGTSDFRTHVDLVGFYPQEADHAWTSGERGLIGLRLSPAIRRMEVSIRSVLAEEHLPVVLSLSWASLHAEVEVRDCLPHFLALTIPTSVSSDKIFWFEVASNRPMRPPNSQDTRVLGACLMSLLVSTKLKKIA